METTVEAENVSTEGSANQSASCWTRWRSWTWLLPAYIVFFSFIKEVKVGEPFLFKYQTEVLNLTSSQIRSEVYPNFPYSYAIALIPIFLLTDLLLYKPTMLLEVLGQIGFRASLVFGGSVDSQIYGTISYGIASASEVAFFSYIYAKLEKDQYRRLTSWTRAGTMSGRTLGYMASQLIILAHWGDYLTLNIIAFILPCIVLVFCIFMPRVHWKRMVDRMVEAKAQSNHLKPNSVEKKMPQTYGQYVMKRIRTLRSDFAKIYRSTYIRRWSFYWALGTAMSLQFALLSQTLWGEVQTKDMKESPLNGLAEAGYTFFAALLILALNSFALDWDKYGETALVIISIIDAIILVIYSQAQSIYVIYIAYRSLYQVMITIAQWNIANKMVCESYGLVFGSNSFIALIMQCLLTVVVTDSRGLGMGIREQYLVYAGCHLVIAFIFFCSILYTLFHYFTRRPKISDTSKDHAHIYTTNTPTLVTDDDVELRKDAIRDGVDMIEDTDPVSSTATSDTEGSAKSDTESANAVEV
ncbi:hypothetical protein M3Y98_00570200 [Aphelenchoides besseyi]|nr:hypothetical protein M3Y98_00570200 [Aphelenchoides besseyi]KAI6193760.1 hypothetical protein M3Y96_01052900 [Aphelenchoides besseyi]